MVKRLRDEGYWVRGVDLKQPEYSETRAHEFILGDLRDRNFVDRVIRFKGYLGNFYASVPQQYHQTFDEIYQFAADMGGDLVSSLLVKMMLILCIILLASI